MADDSKYQIEVIVFAQDMPSTELFDQTRSQVQWPDNVLETASLPQVSVADQMLSAVFRNLTMNSNYQPILHLAWIQNSSVSNSAVRIKSENQTVDGFIQLQQGAKINVTLDLEYQPDLNRFYRINEHRQIKLDEEHYFDHPKFGVIAKVKAI